MTLIQQRVETLQDINSTLSGKLQKIQSVRAKAREEVDGEGLTHETCMELSQLMIAAERNARHLFTGLLSVHQSMAEFVPEGASEASKDWPP